MEKQSNFSFYKDEQNVVRILNHNQAPVRKNTHNSLQLAKEYLYDVAGEYHINKNLLKQLESKVSDTLANEGESYKMQGVKKMFDTTVVDYAQTYFGLPVWRSGLTVVIQDEPLQVVSSSNSSQQGLKVNKHKTSISENSLAANDYALTR